MNGNLNVKEQFDKQAHLFDVWPVTRNEKILGSLYHFFGIGPDDRLLDVACGTGAFSLYAAERTKSVDGVDISEGMIGIAKGVANQKAYSNLEYICTDVEELPFENNSFDSVISKSAFHHMKNADVVLGEMKRCCATGGRVGLEDIIAYGNEHLDTFFENLECEIDACHHRSLSRQEIVGLYRKLGIEITRIFESVCDLNFFEYVEHAFQNEKAKERISELVKKGMQDEEIVKWLVAKDGTIFWRRNVLTIVGKC